MIGIRDLKVRDVMTPAPHCLEETCSLDEAYELFTKRSLSGAPVLGASNELVGVITLRDLVQLAAGILAGDDAPSQDQLQRLSTSTVGDHLVRGPVTCPDDQPLVDACKMMVRERVHRLVVTEFGVPVGVLSAIDVVRALAALDEQQAQGGEA